MAGPLSQEIHRQLARYLAGELSHAEFRRWFEPVLWRVDATSEPAADALAFAIESYDAEYSGGFIDEAELKHQLQAVAAPVVRIHLDEPPERARRRLAASWVFLEWPIHPGANRRVEQGTTPTRHLTLPRQPAPSPS